MAFQDRKTAVGMQLLVGFQGLTAEQELTSLIRDYAIGGIVLFKRNIAGPEQLRSLLNEAQQCALETLKRPLWVAIDQEGGPVQRLAPPYTRLPAARELAEQGEPAVIHWAARRGPGTSGERHPHQLCAGVGCDFRSRTAFPRCPLARLRRP